MSQFKHLSTEEKSHFSQWIEHKVLSGFIHRLSAQQQAQLLQNFLASIIALSCHRLFLSLQSQISSIERRPYAEQECLQKVSSLIEFVSQQHQQSNPDLSVMEYLVFSEEKVSSFYTQLQFFKD